MRSIPFLLLTALFLGSFAVGCIFKPDDVPPVVDTGTYSENLGHPDSLLNDLQVSYRRREIREYATLLAPEFIFKFQEDDITPDIPLGFWNKDEDSTGTKNLFETVQVTQVRIDLTWFEYESAFTSAGEPAQRAIIRTNLEVDLADGETTLQVPGDQQLFFFRQGKAENGEDESRWYISEWQDLGDAGGTGAPKERSMPASTRVGQKVERVTVGELRQRLQELN